MKHSYRRNRRRGTAYLLAAMILLPLLGAPLQMALATEGGADSGTLKRSGIELKNNDIVLQSDTLTWEQSVIFDSNTTQTIDLPTGLLTTGADAILFRPDSSDLYKISVDIAATKITVAKPADTGAVANMLPVQYVQPEDNEPEPETPAPEPSEPEVPEVSEPEQSEPQQPELVPQPEEPEETAPQTSPQIDPEIQEEPTAPSEPEPAPDPEQSETPEEPAAGIDPEALFSAAFFSLVPHAAAAGDSYTLSVPCKIDPTVKNAEINIGGVQLLISGLKAPEMEILKRGSDGKYTPLKTTGEQISLNDTLGLEVKWTGEKAEDKGDLDGVLIGNPYQFAFPPELGVANVDISDQQITLDGFPNVTVATYSVKKGSNLLEVTFKEIKDQTGAPNTETKYTKNVHLQFDCKLQEGQLNADDQGVVKIQLPGGKEVSIKVTEKMPGPPKLEKSTDSKFSDDGTVTWIIKYTPATGAYKGDIPTKLKDILPEGMEYVANSFKIDNTVPPSDVQVLNNIMDITLPTDLMAGEHVFTYQTRITAKQMVNILKKTAGSSAFKNIVQGYINDKLSDDAILQKEATATIPDDWSGRNPLSKEGADVRIDGGKYYIDWTILVNAAKQTFTKLVVNDTLGKELVFDKNNVKILADSKDVTNEITVTHTGSADAPTNVAFALIPDGTTANTSKQAALQYKITYTTEVKPDYFQHTGTVTDEDVTNTATLDWAWPTGVIGPGETPKSPEIIKGPKDITGLDDTLISKNAVKYDPTTRALTWRVTINPHRVDLTAMTLKEDLTSVDPAHSFSKTDENDDKVSEAEAKATLLAAVNAALQNVGITDSVADAGYTLTHKTMTMRLPAIGRKTFSFDYVTYVDKPGIWANNGQKTFSNTIQADDITVNSTAVNSITVQASQNATVTVLQKATTHYDPATKQITWKLTVNKSGVPLTGVTIEDTLPKGLHYVPGSAKIDDQQFDESNITNNEPTLIFDLKDQADKKKAELSYNTSIESTEVNEFLKESTVSFENQAKLISKQYPNGVSVKHTFALDNQPLTKEAPEKLFNNNMVTYTVKLNPLGIKLLPDDGTTKLSLTDTLSPGLYPDIDSIKVCKGAVTADLTKVPCAIHMAAGEPVSIADIRYDSAQNAITIPNLEDKTPYYITYNAYATRTGVELNNNVSLFGSRMPHDSNLDSTNHDLQFSASSGATFGMPPNFFSIEVSKADATNHIITWTKPEDAAVFGLYQDSACKQLLSSGPTASTGVWLVGLPKKEALQYGKLYIKEIKAPDGYQPNPNPLEITITDSTPSPYEIAMVNIKENATLNAQIALLKTDNTNNPISGVQFGLFSDPDAKNELATAETDAAGKCSFTGLYPGATYYVKELAAPDTHVLSDTVYAFEAGTNQEFSIINAKAEAVIRITKVREDNPNIKLPGAKFKLFADEKGTVQKGDELETDENGVAEFKGLRPNTIYYLRETVVPSGYENQDELLNKLIKIETGENNANLPVEITVSNKKILVSIKVVKVREGREATKIEGAKFELYESDKQTIAGSEKATDSNGELIFVNLEPQTTYYVKETVTPTGYKTPQNVWTEVTTKDFTDLVPKELKITNEKILVSLHVIKKGDGAAGPRLPGAKLALYEADKTTLVHAAQTTDANGETTFTNLEPETTYYIRETEAPKGYRIKNEWTEVKTGAFDAAQPAATTVVNEKILVGIRVIKVREGDPETKLEGAKFELYSDAEGKSLLRAAQATDANGVTEFLNLQPETVYYLKETEAPSGYRILTDGLIEIKTGEGAEGAQPVEQVVENARRRSSSSSRPKPPAEEPETPVVPVGPTDPVNPADPTGPDQPAKPDDPTNPDDPQDAGDPSKPGGSDDPANPDKPGDPSKGDGTVTVPSESTPGGAFGTASSGNRVSSIPETGVRDRIPLWALGLACSLGLAAVLCLSQLIFRPKGKHMKKRG
ncbi:SpaA isopeptide-forming pilin-related protein [Agathobaculum sp. NTUH-O15-33]|uniref:SpaA isopeptide-forming pilin-related protein n=1 Tax=Agathobaculum sp. NTUH-O15-33 TaxID=3079302 RepID=UPI00295857D9|nr:SpaA isopeptide-forming pilin-related protein [Agathobaculum sp. NTUH-O15-33]WNX84525.1 SpaA isopeptide-forming pilin-related protein [Agathobaculum sp. NTUH-O15-33]